MIQVAGLRIQEPKNLSIELKSFIENAKEGSVLFSMGTNIDRIHLVKIDLKQSFKHFQNLPQYNFIWKFE
jgi:hypothetical protein